MVFMIGLCLGLGAAALRSAVSVALTGILIVVAFVCAALMSSAGAQPLALAYALGGYNLGLAAAFLSVLAFTRRHAV